MSALQRLHWVAVVVLAITCLISPLSAVPALEHWEPVEGLVTAVEDGGKKVTIRKTSGESISVVPPDGTALKVDDHISGQISLTGDEWGNCISLRDIRRRLVIRALTVPIALVDPMEFVARSEVEWTKATAEKIASNSGKPYQLSIDWEKEMVLCASLGKPRGGGHYIEIVRVEDCSLQLVGHEIVVSVRKESPSPAASGKTDETIDYPTCLVAVERLEFPVRFVSEGAEHQPYDIPFTVISRGQTANSSPIIDVIRDQQKWETWRRLISPTPHIDFNKSFVFISGSNGVGCTGIEITRVQRRSDSLVEVHHAYDFAPCFVKTRNAEGPYVMSVIDNPSFLSPDTTDPPYIAEQFLLHTYGKAIRGLGHLAFRVCQTDDEWRDFIKVYEVHREATEIPRPEFHNRTVVAILGAKSPDDLSWRMTRIGDEIVMEVTCADRPGTPEKLPVVLLSMYKFPGTFRFVEEKK